MSRAARFGCAFVAAAALAFFGYNALSLMLDPYNVVWHSKVRLFGGLTLDQFRFEKTELLLRDASRYDTVILGNSRGSANHTARLSAATGRSVFNYSVSSDYPLGYLMKLRFLLRTQKRLDTVVLLLWIDQFEMAGTNAGALLAREHPAVSGESRWHYYWVFSELPFETLFNAASFQVRRLLGLAANDGVVRDSGVDPASGDFAMWDVFPHLDPDGRGWPAYRKAAASDPSGTLRFRSGVLSPADAGILAKAFAGSPLQDLQVRSFDDTIDLLKSAGLHYDCVIPAMNAAVVGWIPRAIYLRWMKSMLDRCGELWDFSKPSPVTRDNYNYYDWSHYVPDVSYDMLLEVLRGDAAGIAGATGFGSRVTPANFAAYAAAFAAAPTATAPGLATAAPPSR